MNLKTTFWGAEFSHLHEGSAPFFALPNVKCLCPKEQARCSLTFIQCYGIINVAKFQGAECVWCVEEVMFLETFFKSLMMLCLENVKIE